MILKKGSIKELLDVLKQRGIAFTAVAEATGLNYEKIININIGRTKGKMEDYEKIIEAYKSELSNFIIPEQEYDPIEALKEKVALLEGVIDDKNHIISNQEKRDAFFKSVLEDVNGVLDKETDEYSEDDIEGIKKQIETLRMLLG